ncbi:hypothetical protein Hanom_Chr07g00644501 [Helianthus anomalus]
MTFKVTSEHLFVACHFKQILWQNIALWCRIPPIVAFDFKDLMNLYDFSPGSRNRKKAMHAVVLTTMCIWKTRNEVLFHNDRPNAFKVLEQVKALGFMRVKSRAKESVLTWKDWSSFSGFR